MEDELPAIEVSTPSVDAVVLEHGILSELADLIKWVKWARSYTKIRDAIFLEKVERFVKTLGNIPSEEVHRFQRLLRNDQGFRERVGKNLVLALDRIDDLEKADLLAALFRAYISEEITYPEFRRLGAATDRATIDDLRDFIRASAGSMKLSHELLGLLTPTGFTGISNSGVPAQTGFNESGLYHPFVVTPLGNLFAKVIRHRLPSLAV